MLKRPADMNQLGRRIVDLEAPKDEPIRPQLGGIASARKLTPRQRRERAKKAAAARWD